MNDEFQRSLPILLPREAQYAFLCGAGISAPAPSNLPIAQEFVVEGVFEYLCSNRGRSDLTDYFYGRSNQAPGNSLRFEAVLEAVQEVLDPNLHVLDNIRSASAPNSIHSFLACCIAQGHAVFTTNFDGLIEQAGSGISPMVSDDDFEPYQLINSPLFKLHGGFSDRHGQPAEQTLIASLANILHKGHATLTPQKLKALKELTQDRILVVLGYSGDDDYDIMPALKELGEMKGILWIDHNSSHESNKSQVWDATAHTDCPFTIAADVIDLLRNYQELRGTRDGWGRIIKTDTSELIQIIGNHLFPDHQILLPSTTPRRHLEFDERNFWTAIGLEDETGRTMLRATLSARLFCFVHDWLNAELCFEEALEASLSKAPIQTFYKLLEELATVQLNRGHHTRALYYGRQALAVSEYLIEPAPNRIDLFEILSSIFQGLERSGEIDRSLPPLSSNAGVNLNYSETAHQLAKKRLESETDGPASELLLVLLQEIDRDLKGPERKNKPDSETVLKKCEWAVEIAGAINDPFLRLEALERLCVALLLFDPDRGYEVMDEVEELKKILRLKED